MKYLISMECVKKWDVSQRWVAIYCKETRIEGTVQKGRMGSFRLEQKSR